MYDRGIISKPNYKPIEKVRSIIKWQQIASAYHIKKKFERIARVLVNKKLLSDDGKSMQVLYLDKLGVDYVQAHLDENPNAMTDLEARLSHA